MEKLQMEKEQDGEKESSSIYEKIYPMRLPMMAIGAIVFLVGFGMFVGGFAGLVADMDVKIRRTGPPNLGYMLMLIVSVVVMVVGGVSLFCGCGAIRYQKRKQDLKNGKVRKYKPKVDKSGKNAASGESRPPLAVQNTHSNGAVTYTVTYQYKGPPPAEIDGIPAYPAPPPDVAPILKIDPSTKPLTICQQKKKQKPVSQQTIHKPMQQVKAPPYMDKEALCNVPRKLILVKRV